MSKRLMGPPCPAPPRPPGCNPPSTATALEETPVVRHGRDFREFPRNRKFPSRVEIAATGDAQRAQPGLDLAPIGFRGDAKADDLDPRSAGYRR